MMIFRNDGLYCVFFILGDYVVDAAKVGQEAAVDAAKKTQEAFNEYVSRETEREKRSN